MAAKRSAMTSRPEWLFKGYERTPEMTEKLVAALRAALEAHPEQRLGQVICNYAVPQGRDLFCVYDEIVLDRLVAHVNGQETGGSELREMDLRHAQEQRDHESHGDGLYWRDMVERRGRLLKEAVETHQKYLSGEYGAVGQSGGEGE